MDLPKNLKDEIWDYCRLNNIPNIDEFTLKLIKQGFTMEKYGATPAPREIIVEKIVEKIIEKIVEVPVEKVVEKIVEISTIDPTMSESMKNHIKTIGELRDKLLAEVDISKQLREELENEKNKNKNKKDLYGE